MDSAHSLQQTCTTEVTGRFFRSPCLSIMLRQEELAYIKAISMLQTSPALLKELNMTVVAKEATFACRELQHHARRFV